MSEDMKDLASKLSVITQVIKFLNEKGERLTLESEKMYREHDSPYDDITGMINDLFAEIDALREELRKSDYALQHWKSIARDEAGL